MGFLDHIKRQNLHDSNAQITLNPILWMTLISQYHRFYPTNERNFLHNAATLRDIPGQSGSHIGDAVNFRLNLHMNRHQDVLAGYSKMWHGGFPKKTDLRNLSDLFHIQYNVHYR